MSDISPEHIQPLTAGFAALLVFALLALGGLNKLANR